MVSSATIEESEAKYSTRSAGAAGSMGTYAAPDFTMPSTATYISSERWMKIPTRRPGAAPCAMRWFASRLARSSISA